MNKYIIVIIIFICIIITIVYISENNNHTLIDDDTKNVLLVTAHPDDEVMFFTPTLLKLQSMKKNIHILCLSDGNHEGLGQKRRNELYQCMKQFNINPSNINIGDFKDGPKEKWDIEKIKSEIEQKVNEWNIQTIFTFDDKGVSGHDNHIACYEGVKNFIQTTQNKNIKGLSLKSRNIIQFLGPLGIITNKDNKFVTSKNLKKTWQSMNDHKSQFKWYRKASVIFSRYTYVNSYKNIN